MTQTERLAAIREKLVAQFSDEELRTLCRGAGVRFDDLSGDTLADRASSLLTRLDEAQLASVERWLAQRVASRGPDIHTDGGAVVQGNVTIQQGDFVGRDKIMITEAVAYDVAGLPNPYLGLRAFTFDDRDAFAGRDAKADETVAVLTDPSAPKTLLFITGASGCGKSSFAQAGLLTKLHAHYAQRHRAVQHAVFRPSRDPMAGLRDAFAQLGADEGAEAEGAERSPRPTELRTSAGQVNLIVIDQFEECFTQSDPAARDALFRWLAALPAFDVAHTHVIATLRSDYLNELFEHPALWEIAKRDSVEVRAMSEAELREAIQRPLQARQTVDGRYASKRFEPALVDRLARDAAASATYLPLLQVTLAELWNKGKLVLANYGNLTDAIQQRAEQVFTFADFDRADPQVRRTPEAQAAILDIFLDLVEVSPNDDPRRDVRRRREKAQLTRADPARAALVDELARARLLSISADGSLESVDIIHESLIANWNRLREAVAASRRRLRQRQRFEQQLRWWQGNAQAEGDLLSGVALAEAHELDAAGDVALRASEAQDYLKRSIAREQAEQRRELEAAQKLAESEARRAQEQAQATKKARRLNIALGIALPMFAIAAILAAIANSAAQQSALEAQANLRTAEAAEANALMQQRIAEDKAAEARNQARVALARQLSAQAAADGEQNLIRAWLLGVEAYRTLPRLEVLGGLLHALQTNSRAESVLRGHEDGVRSVAFSSDGNTLVSSSRDGMIQLWDVRDPTQAKSLGEPVRGHEHDVWSVAFSPDGRTLASGGEDGTIRLWDVSDSARIKPLGEPLRGHLLRRQLLSETLNLPAIVFSVAFSPEGKILASGGGDDAIRLWDVSDSAQPKPLGEPLRGHERNVLSVAFSPDGKTLASGSADNAIRLWDMSNPAQPKPLGEPLRGHKKLVRRVAFSPDGKTLVSSSSDNTIRLWDVSAPSQAKPLGEPFGVDAITYINDVAFSSDGKTLAGVGIDNAIRLWDVANPAQPKLLEQPLRVHDSAVASVTRLVFSWESVSFSPDGKTLASGGNEGAIRLWDVSNPTQVKPLGELLHGHEHYVESVAFSPDGVMLASGSTDSTIRLWDVRNSAQAKLLSEPLRTLDEVYSVAFSPDGKTLASGSSSNVIQLWDIRDLTRIKPIGKPLRGRIIVFSVAFSPDGKTLVTGSVDLIHLWDVSDPTRVKSLGEPLHGHRNNVESVAFSPDGRMFASGGMDGTIRLWHVADPSQPQPLGEPLRVPDGGVTSVAFSPDGKTLVSGSTDWTIWLWDVSNPTRAKLLGEPLHGHESSVSTVVFSPDGKTLASGGVDKTIRLWDVSDPTEGKPLGEPLRGHKSYVRSVAFSPDGKTLASGSDDATILLWDVDPESWIARACRIAGRNLTQAEWRFYLPDTPYRKTCPQWPAGE